MRSTHVPVLSFLLLGTAPSLAGAEGDPAQGKFTLVEATAGLAGSGPLVASIQTSMGTFTCDLLDKEAPGTVANFVGLARGARPFRDPKSGQWVKRPFYDGLIFHRVIPGFMIQGGDPEGSGSGDPGYQIPDEQNAPHRFDKAGVLAMANAGPNTAGCQFLPHLCRDAVALDLGSNVGGMSSRLAPHCKTIFGIDFAFASTVTARRILLRQPIPLTEYTLQEEGRHLCSRRLDVVPRSNVEFMVATAMEMPFKQGTFDLLICANVLDCGLDPKELLVTMTQALKSGGLLVLSTPYAWHTDGGPTRIIGSWLGEPGKQGAAQDLRDRLGGHYDLLWEEDNVPWVLREYSRWYSVWLNHCLIARKR